MTAEIPRPLNPVTALQEPNARLYYYGEPADLMGYYAGLLHGTIATSSGVGPPSKLPNVDLASLEKALREVPSHTGGLPLVLNAAIECGLETELADWERAINRIPVEQRAARAFSFSSAVFAWLAHERHAGRAELIGILALELLCVEQHWREIAISVDGRPAEPLFASAAQFVTSILDLWGMSAHESRISHRRRAARLWLRLRARQLPVPDNLNRIEALSTLENAVELYSKIVRLKGGRLPTHTEITLAIAEGADALNRPQGSMSKQKRTRIAGLLDELDAYALSRSDPVLSGICQRLRQAAENKTIVKQKITRALPRLAPEMGCPFHLREEPQTLHITVERLPDPMPYRARASIPRRAGWIVCPFDDGRWQVAVPLDENPAKANAQRAEAFAWMTELCADMHAPLPQAAA